MDQDDALLWATAIISAVVLGSLAAAVGAFLLHLVGLIGFSLLSVAGGAVIALTVLFFVQFGPR